MSLLGGDLTTPQRVAVWIPNAPSLPSPILSQLITSMTALVYNKLNRARLYNQLFTRVFDGVGTMQLTLPDWPVTSVLSVQQGQALVPPSVVVAPGQAQPINTSPGYGYRFAAAFPHTKSGFISKLLLAVGRRTSQSLPHLPSFT